MPIDCPKNTNIVVNNTPDPCGGVYGSTDCISTPNAIVYLSIPAESTQTEINTAVTLDLINKNSRIEVLEGNQQIYTDKVIDIDGSYLITVDDNRKFIYINSAVNSPTLTVNPMLPIGFECTFFTNGIMDEIINISTQFISNPKVTVPSEELSVLDGVKNWGIVHLKKRNNNLCTFTGDLYNPQS